MDCPKCYDKGKGLVQMYHKYEKGCSIAYCPCGKQVIIGFGEIK